MGELGRAIPEKPDDDLDSSFLCNLVKLLPWLGDALSESCKKSPKLRAAILFGTVFGIAYPIACFAVVFSLLRFLPSPLTEPVRAYANGALDVQGVIDATNKNVDGTELDVFEYGPGSDGDQTSDWLRVTPGQEVQLATYQRIIKDTASPDPKCLRDIRGSAPDGDIAELAVHTSSSTYTAPIPITLTRDEFVQALDSIDDAQWSKFFKTGYPANKVDLRLNLKREGKFLESVIACGQRYEIFILITYLKPRAELK